MKSKTKKPEFDGRCHCLRCGHDWHAAYNWRDAGPRYTVPKRCARCRSPRWNLPVKEGRRRQSARMQGNETWRGETKRPQRLTRGLARRR